MTLTRKIGLLLLLPLLAALLSIVFVASFLFETRAEGRLTNVAGRQRLLAADLRSWAEMVIDGHAQDRQGLQARVAEFHEALQTLQFGGHVQGRELPPAPLAARPALAAVASFWAGVKPELDLLALMPDAPPDRQAMVARTRETTDRLRVLSEDVVVALEARFRQLRTSMFQALVVLASLVALGFGVGLWVVRRHIVGPITLLGDAAKRIAAGEFHHRLETSREDELADLSRTFNEMTAQVEQLDASEARYRALFYEARDALMVLAPPNARVASVNPAALEVFGASTEAALVGRVAASLSPELQPSGRASGELFEQMLEIAHRERSHFFEWTFVRLTGESFPASVLLAGMEVDGQSVLLATVRDESELRNLRDHLEQAERMASIGTVAAGVAHEISTGSFSMSSSTPHTRWGRPSSRAPAEAASAFVLSATATTS